MQSRSVGSLILAVIAVSCLSAACVAQNQPAQNPAPAAKSSAHDVVLPVTVLDRHGAPAKNLTAGDFTLTDNGDPQTIKSLTPPSSSPVQAGMLVDTSRGMLRALDAERKAAAAFVDQLLPADPAAATSGNQIFLIHFDREVELLQDFTNSRQKLNTNLQEMGPTKAIQNRQGPETNDSDSGYGGPMNVRITSPHLYDAIYLASSELMKSRHGRKVLIVFSNGVDRGSKETLNEAIDAAERANTAIYTIYFRGDDRFAGGGLMGSRRQRPRMGGGWPGSGYPGGYPGGGGGWPGGSAPRGGSRPVQVDGRRILEQIATRTGGIAFRAKRTSDFDKIYSRIATDLHGQYLLTYAPSKLDNDGSFHKIDLKVSKNGLNVSAPEGYYAPNGDAR